MKKIICLVLALTLCAALAAPAFAWEVDPAKPVWGLQLLSEDEAWLTFYNGTDEDVVIPADHDGVTVTMIAGNVFAGFDGLKSVTIPETIKRIGDCAFLNCPSLIKVRIPDSVETIGDKAFGYISDGTEVKKVPGFKILGSAGSAAEKYAKDNGFVFSVPGEDCTHNILTCNDIDCGMTLTKDEWLEVWSKAGNSSTTLSEGNMTIVLCIGCAAVGFLAAMFIFRKKKPAAAEE